MFFPRVFLLTLQSLFDMRRRCWFNLIVKSRTASTRRTLSLLSHWMLRGCLWNNLAVFFSHICSVSEVRDYRLQSGPIALSLLLCRWWSHAINSNFQLLTARCEWQRGVAEAEKIWNSKTRWIWWGNVTATLCEILWMVAMAMANAY